MLRDVALFRGKFTQYDVFNEPIEMPSMVGRCNAWNTTLPNMFRWARQVRGGGLGCLRV